MKITTICVLATGVVALTILSSTHAQSLEQDQPSYRVPKTPPKVGKPVQEPLGGTHEPAAVVGEDTMIAERLNGVVLVKSFNEIEPTGAPAVHGLIVKDIPLLQGSDFEQRIAPYLGRPFKKSTFRLLARDIVLYCRNKDRPVVDVILPEQEIKNGVIQLWFVEGKVGEVTVDNPGKKWFSDQRIRNEVRLQPGDSVDSRKLLEDLDWLNRSPYRQVGAQFKPGKKFAESDVVLQVQDRFPLRPYVGYANSGTKLIGVGQLFMGLNWGDAFGLDQQMNYQYSTDAAFEKTGAHSGSYLIPLPWRHVLAFYGSFAEVDTESISGLISQRGKSYGGSMRYTAPLAPGEKYHHELTLGFDYKVGNNNLEFGGITVSKTDVDVVQFQLGYTASLPDTWGQTAVVGEMYVSPGALTSRNTTKALQVLRSGADADYVYGRMSVERVTRLPADFSWLLRVTGQLASGRLPPSEEMGFGGAGIRGYYERTESGDEGWIVNNELRSPPISLLGLANRMRGRAAAQRPVDQFQVLGFWDYGQSTVLQAKSNFEEPHKTLSSVGAGLRYTVNPYLSVQFDYGWELKKLKDPSGEESPGSQMSISVLVSY